MWRAKLSSAWRVGELQFLYLLILLSAASVLSCRAWTKGRSKCESFDDDRLARKPLREGGRG